MIYTRRVLVKVTAEHSWLQELVNKSAPHQLVPSALGIEFAKFDINGQSAKDLRPSFMYFDVERQAAVFWLTIRAEATRFWAPPIGFSASSHDLLYYLVFRYQPRKAKLKLWHWGGWTPGKLIMLTAGDTSNSKVTGNPCAFYANIAAYA